MAISPANIDLIPQGVKFLGVTFKDVWVGELGNINIRQLKCTAKSWFKKKGSKHTSFDINGKDGAIAVDLCKPIPDKYKNKFNMVTNFGTTEHVEDQTQVFRNIHDMTTVGGVMIHSVPLHGYWKGHCPFRYTAKFPPMLSGLNGYSLKFQEIRDRWKEKLLNFIVQKTSNEFVAIDLSAITVSKKYKKNTDNLF